MNIAERETEKQKRGNNKSDVVVGPKVFRGEAETFVKMQRKNRRKMTRERWGGSILRWLKKRVGPVLGLGWLDGEDTAMLKETSLGFKGERAQILRVHFNSGESRGSINNKLNEDTYQRGTGKEAELGVLSSLWGGVWWREKRKKKTLDG